LLYVIQLVMTDIETNHMMDVRIIATTRQQADIQDLPGRRVEDAQTQRELHLRFTNETIRKNKKYLAVIGVIIGKR
jgi:hypothetical protein